MAPIIIKEKLEFGWPPGEAIKKTESICVIVQLLIYKNLNYFFAVAEESAADMIPENLREAVA